MFYSSFIVDQQIIIRRFRRRYYFPLQHRCFQHRLRLFRHQREFFQQQEYRQDHKELQHIAAQHHGHIFTQSADAFTGRHLTGQLTGKCHDPQRQSGDQGFDDNKKEIYIGSATRLGDRVKPNRHEIPGWNKFRYEIVSPEYHDFLRMIEYHSIMNFATFFKNSGNLTSLKLSEYTLVNKDYKYYQK